ncbi:MAG: hypothetical protein JSU72_03035 [Deltaproteobacteria bacterium]|nr:MAG: hypothetical protein JSU72_03035 [Deltaproteobacteria bacterium]
MTLPVNMSSGFGVVESREGGVAPWGVTAEVEAFVFAKFLVIGTITIYFCTLPYFLG